MKYAFVCWRPYQVFNTINIVYNGLENISKDDLIDLYILKTDSMKSIYNQLSESDLFSNLYYFDYDEDISKRKEYIYSFFAYLFPKFFVRKSICNKENQIEFNKYNMIFASGWLPFFVCLAECNKNAKIIFFEDGFATYLGTDNPYSGGSVMNKLFYFFTKKGKKSILIDKAYVYAPELVEGFLKDRVFKLPSIDNQLYRILSDVFMYNAEDMYSHKDIIYFLQPYSESSLKDKNVVDKVIDILSKKSEKCLLRNHPRMNVKNDIIEVDMNKGIWELSSNGLSDRTMLVSIGSSTMITPFLLYNKIPTLVFLHKIALKDNNQSCVQLDDFLERFKKVYKGMVYIPYTISEFDTILSIGNDYE